MDDLKIELKKEDFSIVPCEVIFTFTNSGNNYVVYTDNKYDSDNDLNILASKYKIVNEKVILENLTDEEFDLVDKKIIEKLGK